MVAGIDCADRMAALGRRHPLTECDIGKWRRFFLVDRRSNLTCLDPCPIFVSGRVCALATENEVLDRIGKTIFKIAIRHEIGRLLHLWAGISHGDTKTTSLEHCDIIAASPMTAISASGIANSFANSDSATPLFASGWVMSR